MASRFGAAPIFLFFAFMMVLQLLWVIFKMPETKGVSLEELEAKLVRTKSTEPKIVLLNS
jgi:hypothetical protein